MSLVVLAVATSLFGTDVLVPPIVPFSVGSTAKSNFTISARPEGNEKRLVVPGTIVCTDKEIDANGLRVYKIALDTKVGTNGKSIYELKTDAYSRPISCIELGEKVQQDATNSLIFMMRQPLWPTTKTASTWKTTLPNPGDIKKPIPVSCSATLGRDRKTITLVQEIIPQAEDQGQGIEFKSVLRVLAKTGQIVSINVTLAIAEDGKKVILLQFNEKS